MGVKPTETDKKVFFLLIDFLLISSAYCVINLCDTVAYKFDSRIKFSVQFRFEFKPNKMWLKLLLLIGTLTFALADSGPRKLYKTQDEEVSDELLIAPFRDPYDNIDYRLPNNTKPIRYDIKLTTDVHNENFTFTGRVTIEIEAVENSAEVTLHYRLLTIVNVALLRSTGGTIQPNVPFTANDTLEFLIIKPTQRLIAGTRYLIAIDYVGILRNDDAGFYRSSYVDILGTRKWLATTQFESTDARHAFPW